MAQQLINNTGSSPDSLYTGTTKINENFADLYANKQDLSAPLTEIATAGAVNDDMLVYSDGWVAQGVTDVRALLVDGYVQPHSTTLDALTLLTPGEGDLLAYTNTPENSWTYITMSGLQTNLIPSRPTMVEFYDDFLFPKFTSTTNIDSVIPWVGVNLTYYPTSFQYGAVGTYNSGNVTNLTKTLFVDNTYTTSTSPGLKLNSPNLLSKFRVARVASPVASGISYFGHFESTTVATAYGAYFKVTDGGNLFCVTKNAAGTTSTDSGITLPDDTFKTLSIVTLPSGTEIGFLIDDVTITSHTTHILTTGATKFGIACSYVGPSGQSGSVWIDYLYIAITGVNRL